MGMQQRILVLGLLAGLVGTTGCGPKYPKCDKDKDCHEKEFCVSGQCQQCRDNGDCADGEQCNKGACEPIPGYCKGNEDCPEGQSCKENRCTACASTSDCSSGMACVDGRCQTAQCATDEDCGPGESCRGGMCGPALAAGGEGGGCKLDPVYFQFDSTDIDADARKVLQKDAECIQSRTGAVITEGHCDPRGTTEYNMALGEHRARVVKKYMSTLGVAESKLKIVSKGEEEATGTDEAGWAKDRRAEFK